MIWGRSKRKKQKKNRSDKRLIFFKYGIIIWAGFLILKLFDLQVLHYRFYSALALGQREIYEKLIPERGVIYLQDKFGKVYPLAANEDRFLAFADTRLVQDAEKTAQIFFQALNNSNFTEPKKQDEAPSLDMDKFELIKARLSKENDPFEPLERGISEEKMQEIKNLDLAGIDFIKESFRIYSLGNISSHIAGFVGEDEEGQKKGRYGVEAYFENELAGKQGFLKAERDIGGRFIPWGIDAIEEAQDGKDIVLTIDRNIQYIACEKLNQAVARHGAEGGSVVIMDPKTGRILAMCGAPDFDPNNFAKTKDIAVFHNPAIFNQYEPGSVFKVITMASALDLGEVSPETTYEDKGRIQIGAHSIANSDNKIRGIQTMTQVLEQSLNTGAVFAAFKVGNERFSEYVYRFGFGKPTGVELPGEAKGDIAALGKKGEIYLATASFGQGITATPLQLVTAVAAIANEGKLMKPYIVDKKIENGEVVFENHPTMIRQVITPKTSALLSGMMVRVVEAGHGKRAGVPGYFIAGKTGTAQIPKKDGPGYESGATIGSFIGFAPVDNPRFAMIVRIDNPKTVAFAESTAAPLFGEIADFVLKYMEVKPTRENK